jgi:hypothetical protein
MKLTGGTNKVTDLMIYGSAGNQCQRLTSYQFTHSTASQTNLWIRNL